MGLLLFRAGVSESTGKVVADHVGVERFNLGHDAGGGIFSDGDVV